MITVLAPDVRLVRSFLGWGGSYVLGGSALVPGLASKSHLRTLMMARALNIRQTRE